MTFFFLCKWTWLTLKTKIAVPENEDVRSSALESSFAVIGLNQSSIREALTVAFSFTLIGFDLARRTRFLRLRCNPATLIPRSLGNPSVSAAGDGPHTILRKTPERHGGRGAFAVVICGGGRRISRQKKTKKKRKKLSDSLSVTVFCYG